VAEEALGARTEIRYVARYEANWYEPELRAFAALARAFGVSMEALLYGKEEASRIAAERELR
jgi:hypothetical protein